MRKVERGSAEYSALVGGVKPLWRARVVAQLGEPDEAVRRLERAMEEEWPVGDNPHPDGFLKPLRGHPAFKEFVRPTG